MNIEGTQGSQRLAEMLLRGSTSGTSGPAPGGLPPTGQLSSITNDQGQSLLDIRDQLKEAVQAALADYDGSGDLRSTVQDAIGSTLEANGFDPAEVKDAMRDAGLDPRRVMRGLAGAAPGVDGGFDPSMILGKGGSEEDLVQAFLQQLRAGANVDFEG